MRSVMPSRRTYRRVFRRIRFYVPLVVILLAAMAFFLPLSAGWMARRAEQEILRATGVQVRIARLNVVIAAGSVEALGVEIVGAKGGASFPVGRLALEGRLSGLLGGGDRWPERIVLDAPGAVELRRGDDGRWALQGAGRALLETIAAQQAAAAQRKSAAGAGGGKPAAGPGRTPEVLLRDLEIIADSPLPGQRPLVLNLDQLLIEARPSSQSAVAVSLSGTFTGTHSETLTVSATAFPEGRRLRCVGRLSGIDVPFEAPPLGRFVARARPLALNVEASEDPATGEYLLAMTAHTRRFELARDRVGGERWEDADLELRLQAGLDPARGALRVRELSLHGVQIDLDAEAEVALTPDLPGSARLNVGQLPAAVFDLARGEVLAPLGVRLEGTSTTPTLRLEAAVQGPFARPHALDGEASLLAAGWSIQANALPEPVLLDALRVTASRRRGAVEELRWRFGGMDFNAALAAGLPAGDGTTTATLRLAAEGDAGRVTELLGRLGAFTPEVRSVRAPIRLSLALQPELTWVQGRPKVRLAEEGVEVQLSWEDGEVDVRRLPNPVLLLPGELRLRGGELRVQRLNISSGSLRLGVDGAVRGDLFQDDPAPMEYDGRVQVEGTIEEALEVLGRQVALPPLPASGLAGRWRVEASGSGRSDRPAEPDYRARVTLDGLRAELPWPWRPIHVEDGALDVTLDREKLTLARLLLELTDPEHERSRIELQGVVTDQEARLEVGLRSTFEYLTAVLAKDLNEMVMRGKLPAEGWGTVRPAQPLPPGPDLLRRWLALLQRPGLQVGVSPPADLLANFEVNYLQEAPAAVFPRDFPVPMENIRGDARFTPEGLRLSNIVADIGSAKGVRLAGLIRFGRPTRIDFDAQIDHFDINEWMSGWGEQEWARFPVSTQERWTRSPEPTQFVDITGRIRANTARFLQFDAANVSTDFAFKAFSRIPGRMWLRNTRMMFYGGPAEGELAFKFFRGGERPHLRALARFRQADLKAFMDALYERPQFLDGIIDGELDFDGQLLNYPTYYGKGSYNIRNSSVIGSIVLVYMKDLLKMTSRTEGRDSTMYGTVAMEDQKVYFPDFVLLNPAVTMTAGGFVDFRGRLDFDLTASVISKRLQQIPVFRIVGDLLDMVGKEIITYRLSGSLKNPQYVVMPTVFDRLEKMRVLLNEARTRFATRPAEEAP